MGRENAAAIGGVCLALFTCGARGSDWDVQHAPRPEPFLAAGSGWTDVRCVACHQIDHALSHPVGFVPARPLPAEFPLERGRTTCLTCHTEAATLTHSEGSGQLLRAGPTGAVRCGDCHDNDSQSHARVMDSAHLAWPAAVARGAAGRDAETRACLECHDGTVAGDAGSHRIAGGFRPDTDHPVGVRYRTLPSQSVDETPLRPVHALDPRVRLFDGAVGCGSCHSLYSTRPGRLVMDNHASALCLSCHAY